MPGTEPLQAALGYTFSDIKLLEQALTHRSHSARHNERLEFLGDSVVNFIVAALLFKRFPKLAEGDLSRLRANLVKQSALADIAAHLSLSQYLHLGEGELKSGGFRRPSILADAVEAIFGAVFLDGGFDMAQRVIEHQYDFVLEHVDAKSLGKDPKTLLQELLQARKLDLPLYTVIGTHGAAHNQTFEVECQVPKLEIKVTAGGTSRRAAEQSAAEQAIVAIKALAPLKGRSAARSRKVKQLSLPVAVAQENK
ncbi:ribonuclease III [Alcaligenaceae bacterium]|nr:ribonuclease III [Alcaligenaceae bacterium]